MEEKRIVIADDAMFMRNVLKKILEKHNYKIVGEAKNGFEAYSLYKMLKPDLMFLDITMPILNGIDALKEIRNYDEEAVVVMCSAMGQKHHIIESIQYGAKDFIVKPFSEERILQSLERIFN